MTLTLALSYGSREIVNAVKNICNKVKNNTISIDSIDDSIINEHLYTQNLPEVDLLIRTSGEHRISNFLLGRLPWNYILLMYCGQTLKNKIYMRLSLVIKKENVDLENK
jgi:undecaprenyl diphosphate synthase